MRDSWQRGRESVPATTGGRVDEHVASLRTTSFPRRDGPARRARPRGSAVPTFAAGDQPSDAPQPSGAPLNAAASVPNANLDERSSATNYIPVTKLISLAISVALIRNFLLRLIQINRRLGKHHSYVSYRLRHPEWGTP